MSNFYAELEQSDIEVARTLLKQAEGRPDAIAMHYGSPFYDPISDFSSEFRDHLLNPESFCRNMKVYEEPRGSLELRNEIATWYEMRHGLTVNPETEIIITNGSIEAYVLSILSVTDIGDKVAITDPTYLLFRKSAESLAREVVEISRKSSEHEYANCLDNNVFNSAKCIVINSPENPTGYILSQLDWDKVTEVVIRNNAFVIHDEILSELDFEGRHFPVLKVSELRQRSVLINGFSKVFGMPGIKLGWMVAPECIINKAIKYHSYLYLGVNPISEYVALQILKHKDIYEWLDGWSGKLKDRRDLLLNDLTSNNGFEWERFPYGGFSATPNVRLMYEMIPAKYKILNLSRGAAVANYLLEERGVTVTPASIYGSQLNDYVKIAFCNSGDEFLKGVNRLKWTY